MTQDQYVIGKKSGNIFRVGIFLDFVRRTTRAPQALNTRGEPNEIELTATHGLLNGHVAPATQILLALR